MARTNNLTNFLTDVADAIREKKGTQATIQASDFDTEIASISSGANINDYFNTTISSYSYTGTIFISTLVQKKIPNITIGNSVTTLHGAFYNNSVVEEIEGINFNNNITDLITMFTGCTNLTSVGLNDGDTSNVTSMWEMFRNCNSLTSLNLSNWETPNLTDTTRMFANCSSLTYLDIRKMTFNSITSYDYMFAGIPQNCEIIVKSQTEKDWVLARRYDLTNVKTVEEYEAE